MLGLFVVLIVERVNSRKSRLLQPAHRSRRVSNDVYLKEIATVLSNIERAGLMWQSDAEDLWQPDTTGG